METIEKLFDGIHDGITSVESDLDYIDICEALITLADTLVETETDEFIYDMGESQYFTLGDLIEGAYWHFSEWHGGQESIGYRALSALGQVFSPGMSSAEVDNVAYEYLNEMASDHFKAGV